MSEPNEPDDAPETDTDLEQDAPTSSAPDDGSDEDAPLVDPAAPVTAVPADEPTQEAATAPANRQLIFIAAALVAALALGGGLYFAFRGDDSSSLSAEDQAKVAVTSVIEGVYKVVRGDKAGCQQVVDNWQQTPENASFLADCTKRIDEATEFNTEFELVSIKPTQVTLDDAAGTGVVSLDVTERSNGTENTQPQMIKVVKVGSLWKVLGTGQ